MSRVRHGAPPLVLHDETPLNGPRIDVGRRVGWLLRTARHLCPDQPRLQDVATEAGASVALVHRVEMGTVRSGKVTSAYEEVLGLAPGTVRAPVDILCRTFPYGPPDRDPGTPITSVIEMSTLTERVTGPAPQGGDWLVWARALAQPVAIGLPVELASALLMKLIGEMDRAVGGGYPSRYEALALMRSGPYGDVMLDVARARVADPHVQQLSDVMSAVGERVTPDAVAWCLKLLRDPRDRVVTAAALSIENLAEISVDPMFWSPLIEPLLEIYNDTDGNSEGWRWLSHLLRLVPATQMAPPPIQPCRPLAPLAHTAAGSVAPYDSHFREAETMARDTTGALGLRDEPMLARLVFDIVFGPHETRAVTGYMLLSALPGLTAILAEHVTAVAEDHPDPVIRERAGRRLAGFAQVAPPPRIHEWLAGNDPALKRVGLRVAGAAGLRLPDELLTQAIADGRVTASALYAAGMTAHPLLSRLAADARAEPGLRGAAEWWLRAGGRVVDSGPDPRIWGCRP